VGIEPDYRVRPDASSPRVVYVGVVAGPVGVDREDRRSAFRPVAMSAGTAEAGFAPRRPAGMLRRLRGSLVPGAAPRRDEPDADAPLEQLLVRPQWKAISRVHPERAKVLARVQAELSEASRLLASGRARDVEAERELRELLLGRPRIRSVDEGWEIVGWLKRLNLRLGRCNTTYVHSLLEYECAHVQDERHWHTWTKHFRKQELVELLGRYRSGPDAVTDAERDRAVDRLNLLYLKRAEAGSDRRARAALKDLYLRHLALVLVPFLAGLGAIALVSSTRSHSVWRAFAVAALAGALGSTLSGVLRLRDQLLQLDELRAFRPAMLVQPLVGASAGALVFLVLASKAFSVGSIDAAAWPSPGLLGFVAGFSEPFFLGLVDRVAGLPEQRSGKTPG
jgi:hypothetical protein